MLTKEVPKQLFLIILLIVSYLNKCLNWWVFVIEQFGVRDRTDGIGGIVLRYWIALMFIALWIPDNRKPDVVWLRS